jgi:hypothetical protein
VEYLVLAGRWRDLVYILYIKLDVKTVYSKYLVLVDSAWLQFVMD